MVTRPTPLTQHQGRQNHERSCIHRQGHNIIGQLLQSHTCREPGQHEQYTRCHFVCKPNGLVGLVNAKVWVEKDSASHSNNDATYKNGHASNGVSGLQVFVSQLFFVRVDRVESACVGLLRSRGIFGEKLRTRRLSVAHDPIRRPILLLLG